MDQNKILYNEENKLYSCSLCGHQSKRKYIIKVHLSKRLTPCNIEKQPIQCNKCETVFLTNTILKKHSERKKDCRNDVNCPFQLKKRTVNNECINIK